MKPLFLFLLRLLLLLPSLPRYALPLKKPSTGQHLVLLSFLPAPPPHLKAVVVVIEHCRYNFRAASTAAAAALAVALLRLCRPQGHGDGAANG